MSANIASRADVTPRGDYVLLSADTLHLLLPRQEVGAAEFLGGTLEPSDEPGLFKRRGVESPRRFAALSAQMNLLLHCPDDRRFVAPIGNGTDAVAWCWNTLQELPDLESPIYPIPRVLLAPNAPVEQYVEVEGKLAYLCSAHRLRAVAALPES